MDQAAVVIVGGGIAGASIALHLARLGQRDVIVLERGALVSGTTSHAPGLVGQLRASPSLCRLLMASVELYRGLELDGQPGFQPVGSLRLASSRQRMEELIRQKSAADRCGLETHLQGAAGTAELFPLIDPARIEGSLHVPSDGSASATTLAGAMIRDARALGVAFREQTVVTGIDIKAGRVCGVMTNHGRIATDTLVIAAGIWSPLLGRMAGISIPLVPMQHQYAETSAVPGLAGRQLPNLRDPDNLVYFRQADDRLILGGYERQPRPFRLPIPASANPTVLPFDEEHFAGLKRGAVRCLPAVADLDLVRCVNGLESFTPDGAFLVGPAPHVQGLWTACGFCAHGISGAGGVGRYLAEWIVSGTPGIDLSAMALSRFAGQAVDDDTVTAGAAAIYSTYYDIPTTTPVA